MSKLVVAATAGSLVCALINRRCDSRQPILFFLFRSCVKDACRSLCLQAFWRCEAEACSSSSFFYCTREQKQGDATVKQECCNKCGLFSRLMNVDEWAEPEVSLTFILFALEGK